ncbi:MAG TPA: MaoC/PaaZ C-terminal domain-containing protein [Casimicrobiaceae bacterium]|nr:MaoC/PaaZ C-terminal domain-containing protein [Casimicrobiaceae bacterium]
MSEPLHYEDVPVGLQFDTGGIDITEAHIVQFAGLSGDFFDVHMDDAFARELGFPRRVAHGILCLALIDGLKNRASERFASVASLHWEWSFRAPVFAGDRLSAHVEVTAKRPTAKGDRGILTLHIQALNQHRAVVQDGTNLLLVRARGQHGAAEAS